MYEYLSQRMERQRVVHFAKSRGAKVVRSRTTKRPLSSPSCYGPHASEENAPLASVESDALDHAKRKDGTSLTPFSLGQERRWTLGADIFSTQPINSDPSFDENFGEISDSSPPRTFVRQRSTNTAGAHGENVSLREIQERTEESPGRFYRNRSMTEPVVPTAKRDHSVSRHRESVTGFPCDSQRSPRPVVQSKEVSHPRNVTKLCNGTVKNTSVKHEVQVQKLNVSCPKMKVVSKTPPPVAPKPKNALLSPQTDSEPDPATIDSCSSPAYLPGLPRLKQSVPTWKENADSVKNLCPKYRDKRPQTRTTNVTPTSEYSRVRPKPAAGSSPVGSSNPRRNSNSLCSSKLQAAFLESQSEVQSSEEFSSPSTLPEMAVPFNFQVMHHDPLPEMYSTLTRSSNQGKDLRKTQPHPIPHPNSNPRKPVVSMDASFKKSVNGSEKERGNISSTTRDVITTQFIVKNENHRATRDATVSSKRSTREDIELKALTKPCDLLSTEDHTTNWKRNSLRLATMGYTSMSDLTNSLECLTLQTHEPATDGRLSSDRENVALQADQPAADGRLSSDRENVALQADQPAADERFSHDGESVAAHEEMKEIFTENIHEDDQELKIVHHAPGINLQVHHAPGINLQVHHAPRINLREVPCFRNVGEQGKTSGQRRSELDTSEGGMCREQALMKLERSGAKRLSYRMATSNMADVWEEGASGQLHSHIRPGERDNRNSDLLCHSNEAPEKLSLYGDHLQATESPVSANARQQLLQLDTTEEEHSNKIKRRSFLLATSSLSDLTFSEEQENFLERSSGFDKKVKRLSDADVSFTSSPSNSFHTPDSQDGRCRNFSFSSAHLNSSFGSFYSCQSCGSGEPRHSPATRTKPHPRAIVDLKQSTQTGRVNGTTDQMDSDSIVSGDTSFYFTASSDTSFNTADTTPVSSPHVSKPKQRKLPTQDQRLIAGKQSQDVPRDNSDYGNLPRKANSLPHRGKILTPSSPIDAMFQCYGCGVKHRNPHVAQHQWNKNNHSRTLNKNPKCERKDTPRQWSREDIRRSHSKPSSDHFQTKLSSCSPRHVSRRSPAFTEADVSFKDQSSSSGIPSTPSSGSLSSFLGEMGWDAYPRFPPSLGRPRRKLYAGFDSQPLPMDSFLSDSSSVYSVQSCGSWGTSRSAEVEGSPRTPEISANTRAVSSIASSAYTSGRPASEGNVFDFLSFTDKRSATCENNHNVYLNRENSCPDDCLKDIFYDKKFSNESLESFKSDDTTVQMEDHPVEYTKSHMDSQPHNGSMYNNNNSNNNSSNSNDVRIRSEKRTNERRPLARLNNSCGSEFGSTPSPAHSKNSMENVEKSSFMTKRKYLSTKDIIDLLMTPDKNSQNHSQSLERQAQKMCEVLLCCNQVVHPSAREYHF